MDDFAERLAAWAAAHGKPVEDLGPDEREVAERSVRGTMERERKEAERLAESAARRAQFEEAMRVRLALTRDLVAFLLARADGEANRREAEFTRKFVTEIVPKVEAMAGEIETEWPVPHVEVVDGEQLLRLRAAVYADCPGYQLEWAPPA